MTFSRHKGEEELMNPLMDKRKHYEHVGRKVLHQAMHGTPIKKDMDLHKRKPMKKDMADIDIFAHDAILPIHERGRKKGGYIEKGEHIERERMRKKKMDGMCHKKGGYIEEGEHIERKRERKREKMSELGFKKGGYIEKGEHIERVREREHKKPHKRMEHHADGGALGHHFHDGHHVHHHHHYKSGGSAKKWIQGAISHPGALRKELHVKKGHDIPEAKLEKAAHSQDPLLKKRAILAETLRGFHKK